MATNIMRITYKGAINCFLALDAIASCGCVTCSFFTQYEIHRFRDDRDNNYAIIAMDESEKMLDFQVCPDLQLRMNLVAWQDRENARSADMDLLIHCGQRGVTWTDSMIIEGANCRLSIEILSSEAAAQGISPQLIAQYQQEQMYYCQQQQQQHR
ncbi:hypothetical protein FBU30_010579 [Linnemannia zychae]|nr:hypothetical protein FBU30_010579 [Linnemannia zychae]